MSEPDPTYLTGATNGTYSDAELTAVPNQAELMDAYRSAVSTAHLLEVILNIPHEKRLVMTRKERRGLTNGST